MKKMLLALLVLNTTAVLAHEKSLEPTDTTHVLNVDYGVKINVVRYEDKAKGTTCYVMLPTGTYQTGVGTTSPVAAVSDISCVKD